MQPTERISASLKPLRAIDFGYEQARHLLLRAGFGGTPRQIQTLVEWGPENSVSHLLNVEKVPFDEVRADAFRRDIKRPPTAEERNAYRMAQRDRDEDALARARLRQQEAERDDRRQIREIQRWWLKRMIETPRPLEEKMTLFWHGHFATSYRTIEDSYHMFLQNQLFRRHALGNAGDLLFAIIRDPAMLAYLDNNDSRRDRPNENLARELMELFSLGVGNYAERDIKEGARALTGYTFEDDEFLFNARNHDNGGKSILGKKGNLDGDGFVSAILEHEACSRFLCAKLYRFFVREIPTAWAEIDEPTRSVIRALASTMLSNRYAIRPVLKRLFLSEHFFARGVVGEQIKSPVDLVVGGVRTLGTPVRDTSILVDALDLMGQNILFPPSVKGWDGGRSWINTSTLFVRQNIMNFLLTGRLPQGYEPMSRTEKFDPSPLLGELAHADPGAERNHERVCDYLLRFTLGATPAHARGTLLAFVSELGGEVTPDLVSGLLLLITTMPEYQLC